MKLWRLFLLLMIGFASAGHVYAQDPTSDAANEISDEMLQCAGFFAILGHCFEAVSDEKQKANAIEFQRRLTETAGSLGRQIGLLDATLTARTELHMKGFQKKLANDCRNIDILINEIGGRCHALANDPMPRLREIIANHSKR